MMQMECKALSLCYNRKQVVENLSLQIEKGDFLCIVGENGSGKSTLLKGLLGLKKPDGGEIVFHNGFSTEQIGYLPQQDGEREGFPATVKEVVMSGLLKNKSLGFFYTKEQKTKALDCMKALEIESLASVGFSQLSGGQKQRVLLARAFAGAESMLILDEPINGLDPLVAKALYRFIVERNRKEKITVVMVSHDVNNAMTMATKILHLGHDASFFGTPEDYQTSSLGQAFLKGVWSCG